MEESIRSLKGIGEKTEALFAKTGVRTIRQLLSYYPRDYDVYAPCVPIRLLQEGKICAVCARLGTGLSIRGNGRKTITTGTVYDETGEISLLWYNMPYLRSVLKKGGIYVFRGKPALRGHRLILEHPAYYALDAYDKLTHSMQPVYSLTSGLSNKTVTKAVKLALSGSGVLSEWLPKSLLQKYKLCSYDYAIRHIHFPRTMEEYVTARNRLVFEEFFLFILKIQTLKKQARILSPIDRLTSSQKTTEVIRRLPYRLTSAQTRVWQEIEHDLCGSTPMARLVQGDVGSGKTVIAFLAMLLAAENQTQAALMAPTEVLAKQHYESLRSLLCDEEWDAYHPVLLTGSTTSAKRRDIYEAIGSGVAKIIIGTHALIQEKVKYHHLTLVITDEQHRFGVHQRENLLEKGSAPHMLVMSATPIPRTLAVILYGELSISTIDELPARRIPIKNCVIGTKERTTAWKFIQKQITAGHQAYIICPLVSESEELEGEDVASYSRKLEDFYPTSIRIGTLHGKMPPAQKNEVMDRFSSGEIQILVSTTVVEVGVNVPNATVMMVENAERFGLAQLHQLRGRVGRGSAASYCIFLRTSDDENTCKRLEILNHSNDGFAIARKDMELRGPGELLGVRQSGDISFGIADIYQDTPLLKQAAQAAEEVFDQQETDAFQSVRERLSIAMSAHENGIIL